MAYIQLALQFFLKGGGDDLLVCFYCLQFSCYFTIYSIPMPCVCEIYIEQFRNLINFEMLKSGIVDAILKLINKDWSTAVVIDYLFGDIKRAA